MQSVLIWARAVPLSGCWVHCDGSAQAGGLCAPSITSCWDEQRNSGWQSWVFDLGAPGPSQPWDLGFSLHVISLLLRTLNYSQNNIYGHYLNSEGFEQSLWLSCICHTHSDLQSCSPSCSAPCRTEPFTNPPKSKSIDFQSNPPGFLIYISWTSCLLKLSLFCISLQPELILSNEHD